MKNGYIGTITILGTDLKVIVSDKISSDYAQVIVMTNKRKKRNKK